jgi:glycosyltransferase involved in cell wall biosynthesis
MTICFFGDYNSEYARNRVLIRGLKENGVNIIECNVRSGSKLKRHWGMITSYLKNSDSFNILLIGYSEDRWLVLLAKILAPSKVLVWDAFYSVYDKYVYDRKVISCFNPKAWYWWLIEYFICRLPDFILLDTQVHIDYFIKQFNVSPKKFIRVFVGTDIELDRSIPIVNDHPGLFLVHFHGGYIPLQGVKYIIQAAKILEKHHDIRFNLIGRGQTWLVDRKLADYLDIKNINFIDYLPFDELTKIISQADICLGIFGDTMKTQRVIPNKVYEAAAMAKPIITGDTPAMKELFVNRENILLCRIADVDDLVEKILELKNNKELRNKIAQGGYKLFIQQTTPKVICQNLLAQLNDL